MSQIAKAKKSKSKANIPAAADDLDAILNEALDDFQDQEMKAKVAAVENGDESQKLKEEKEAENVRKLQELLANMEGTIMFVISTGLN